MAVETYSHVMHIVSNVSGTLRDGRRRDGRAALGAARPARCRGAPKVRAMQIIDELEPVKRGGYGGAIGYLSYTGDLDTCIHIRTVVVKDGVAHVQAGGGTVADAKPAYEFAESEAKARGRACARSSSRCEQPDWPHDDGSSSSTTTTRSPTTSSSTWASSGAELDVVRNDRATVDELLERRLRPRRRLARARARPNEAGISLEAVRALPRGRRPDARRLPRPPVARAGVRRRVVRHEPVHGKTTTIEHDGRTIFGGLPSPLTVGRYHSLVVDRRRCPTASRSPRAAAAS